LTAALLGFSEAAEAAPILFTTDLSGPAEAPPNASPGTGFASVLLDTVANTMTIEASFADLIGSTTAAHIHCCTAIPLTSTAGVAVTQAGSLELFPLGVTSGIFSNTFDTTLASTYRAAFITANGGTTAGAEAALLAGLLSGRAYFNIHTTQFPGGEIRGFLQDVTEPSTIAVFGFGLLGLAGFRWRNTASTKLPAKANSPAAPRKEPTATKRPVFPHRPRRSMSNRT